MKPLESVIFGKRADTGSRWTSYLLCAISTLSAFPQTLDVDTLIAQIKKGESTPATFNALARSGSPKAIPILQERFPLTTDVIERTALASALVRLGGKNPAYWKYLFDEAQSAIISDIPFPGAFDENGNSVPRQLAPSFLEWARLNGISPNASAQAQLTLEPAKVTLLAITGDPRGTLILLKGLNSPNYLIKAAAAKGLARLRQRDAIPAIIAAADSVPSSVKPLIARALVFFDDSRAQIAAERLIPDKPVLEELRRLSREKGTDGLF